MRTFVVVEQQILKVKLYKIFFFLLSDHRQLTMWDTEEIAFRIRSRERMHSLSLDLTRIK